MESITLRNGSITEVTCLSVTMVWAGGQDSDASYVCPGTWEASLEECGGAASNEPENGQTGLCHTALVALPGQGQILWQREGLSSVLGCLRALVDMWKSDLILPFNAHLFCLFLNYEVPTFHLNKRSSS